MFARYCSGWLCLSCCEGQGSKGQKGSSARLSSLHEVICCRNVNAQLKSFRWVFGNSDLVRSWLESLGTFPRALDQKLHKFVLFKGGDPGGCTPELTRQPHACSAKSCKKTVLKVPMKCPRQHQGVLTPK